MSEILDRIVQEALRWDGVEEIPGNMGWEREEFQHALEEVGWDYGLAWCAFFVKMVFYKIYANTIWGSSILKNFSGSATKTLQNCQADPRWFTHYQYEVTACVGVFRWWKDGVRDWRGHEVLVTQPGGGYVGGHFRTVEGNVGQYGKVKQMTRLNNYGAKDGLVFEGFVFPPIPLEKLDPKIITL